MSDVDVDVVAPGSCDVRKVRADQKPDSSTLRRDSDSSGVMGGVRMVGGRGRTSRGMDENDASDCAYQVLGEDAQGQRAPIGWKASSTL